VAVFGNGYNNSEADGHASTTGRAYLFIVDIETGKLIKKIDTGVGATGTPNGLASPALIDTNGDFVVDYIYAGDLLKQSITNQFTMGFDTDDDGVEDKDYVLREVSDYPINYNTHMGWYMDLIPEKVN